MRRAGCHLEPCAASLGLSVHLPSRVCSLSVTLCLHHVVDEKVHRKKDDMERRCHVEQLNDKPREMMIHHEDNEDK